ncbi:MAG: 1-acyl-sn-glycerol-3-phosphate acyltransferase [Paludibacteraceae bacterium]|nr:1-acyl-sn-glycerol-3-phosphate acyltransferase [Paludibacteraceae bacterium]
MEMEYSFDTLRPYRDEEVRDAFLRVTKEPEFKTVMKYLFQDKADGMIEFFLTLNSVYDFQSKVIAPFLLDLSKKTMDSLTISGLDNLKGDKKYLIMSNHRDIVGDAAILNTLMITNGFDTAENAIGDNLCSRPWITEMMKLNKNFIVKRSGTKREIFEASKLLSSYIRKNIVEKSNSIWIAQREGRAKDANDRTQESLLKMFSMSSGSDLKQGFLELNILPVSISYEYDACDYLKAKEFQQKRDDANFKKSKEDDVLNMQVGLTGYKGRVHYEVMPDINDILQNEISDNDDRTAIVEKVAVIIDRCIHANYQIYPGNYVALDLLEGRDVCCSENYTAEEKERFVNYLNGQIDKIDLANKDTDFLKTKILEMYANPLKNYIVARDLK